MCARIFQSRGYREQGEIEINESLWQPLKKSQSTKPKEKEES